MQKQLVWDLPVRLFHWLLVTCLLAQWLTAEVLEDATQWHAYIGYFTLGLITFRLLWGFIGTRYARFSSFIAAPKSIWAYAKSLFSGNYQPHVGHNPLGGLLLPLVLILVGLQAVSGFFVTDDIIFTGPYYASVSDEFQKIMQSLHHSFFDWLLYLIGGHLLALAYYRFKLKQHLVKPMLSGYKEVNPNQGVPHSSLLKAVILAILVGVFIYWLVVLNAPIIEDEYYY